MFICLFGVREMDVSSVWFAQNGALTVHLTWVMHKRVINARLEFWKDYLGLRIEKDYLRLGKTFFLYS